MLFPLWFMSWRALTSYVIIFFPLRYVYEFARRHRNIPAGFVLNVSKNNVRIAERCCHPSVKNSCFLQEEVWRHLWLHSLETLGWHDPSERGDVGWMHLTLIIFYHFFICNHMRTHSNTHAAHHSSHNSYYSGKTSYRTMLLLEVTTKVTGAEMRNGGQRVTQKANYRYSVLGSRNCSDMKHAMSG